MGSSRDVVVFSLRKACLPNGTAAEVLATHDGEIVMPEWDEELMMDDARRVRTAALAVAQGCRVHIQDLGHLVQYVADMLEA